MGEAGLPTKVGASKYHPAGYESETLLYSLHLCSHTVLTIGRASPSLSPSSLLMLID